MIGYFSQMRHHRWHKQLTNVTSEGHRLQNETRLMLHWHMLTLTCSGWAAWRERDSSASRSREVSCSSLWLLRRDASSSCCWISCLRCAASSNCCCSWTTTSVLSCTCCSNAASRCSRSRHSSSLRHSSPRRASTSWDRCRQRDGALENRKNCFFIETTNLIVFEV